MKVQIIAGPKMAALRDDYARIAKQQGFKTTTHLVDDGDLIHLIYPLSKTGIKAWLSTPFSGEWDVDTPVLLHFHGDDTRPRTTVNYWLLKRLLSMPRTTVAYSTPDLEYNLEWLAPDKELFELPAPVDLDKFRIFNEGEKRKRNFLIAGELYHLKHWKERFDMLSRRKFDVIYYGEDKELYKEIAPCHARFLAPLPSHLMPVLYNQYKWIVPQASLAYKLFGSMGRVELEALACGCMLFDKPGLGRKYVEEHHGDHVIGEKLARAYNATMEVES